MTLEFDDEADNKRYRENVWEDCAVVSESVIKIVKRIV